MAYDEINRFCYLNIGYGFQNKEMVRMSVPIHIGVSKDVPCAALAVRLDILDTNNPKLDLILYRKPRNYKYGITNNGNHESMFTLLTPFGTLEDVKKSGWIVYNETVEMFLCTFDDLLL